MHHMRRISLFAGLVGVAACSVFGSDDPPAPAPPVVPPGDAAPGPTAPSVVNGRPVTGVFVSSSIGRADGTGTLDSPLRTLKAAIARSREIGEPVVACAEHFAEPLEIVAGVSVIGNFDCTTPSWTQGTKRATLDSPTSPALIVTRVNSKTRLEGFEVRAPDFGANEPGAEAVSSIALLARDSSSFEVVDVLLHAGTGAPGTPGTEGDANAELSTKTVGIAGDAEVGGACAYAPNCNGVTKVLGPAAGKSTCKVGPSGGPGGKGGDGKFYASCFPQVDATRQPHGLPLVADANTAAGGLGYCASLTAGALINVGYGSAGAAGADGPDGANGKWTLTAEGAVPGHGQPGSDGSPGQGGGGGGGHEVYPLNSVCSDGLCPARPAATYMSSTGGGGGAGGCAGLAGTPGHGGGASIAALVVGSPILFKGSRLESSAGGAAGKGSLGSNGLAAGGGAPAVSNAGAGGNGGKGGASGLSGHGAPGPSVALAVQGAKPVLESTELVPGAGGAGHPQLSKDGNAGVKLLPAVTGESLKQYDF